MTLRKSRNAVSNINLDIVEILRKEQALMPFPPTSLADIRWFIDTFFNTFNFHDSFDFGRTKLNLTGIVALAFLLGCISMFSRDKEKFMMLFFPILFTLLASALHQYPFKGRLILFLSPLLVLFIGEGISKVWEKTSENYAHLGIIFVALIFIYPVSWAAYHAKKPLCHSHIKSALSYISDNWREGDILYVHYFAQYEFDYYSKYDMKSYDFNENEVVIGIAPRGWYNRWKKQEVSKYYNPEETITQTTHDVLNIYLKDLDRVRNHKRVWILFTAQAFQGSVREEDFFIYHLDSIGEQLDKLKLGGTAAYLYDLSEE